MEEPLIRFTLNGKETEIDAPPDRRVIDLLREDLGLTGAKEGCGSGECGACTIVVDGETRLSCLMLSAQLEGRSVQTVEGISQGDELHPVQQSFVEHGAVQCGYCTSGMVLTSLDLLKRTPSPSRDEIVDAVERVSRNTGKRDQS